MCSPQPSRWTFDCTQERLLGNRTSPSFPGWKRMWRGSPLRLPCPSQACGAGHRGAPSPVLAPRVPVLQDRDHKKNPRGEGALCFVHVPTSESGTATMALSKPSHPLSPHPSYSVGDALSLLAPELCSNACAGQASSPFPGWPPRPLRGTSHVPTQP